MSTTRRVLIACALAACLPGALWAAHGDRLGSGVGRVEMLALAPVRTAEVEITSVADGDTVSTYLDGQPVRLRLAAIDAPERGQPWGRRATQSLRELVWKKRVQIEWREVDRYGRPIVTIRVDGRDVSAEQVRRGMAWVFRRYSNDPMLLALEQEARAAKRGLWADPKPVPPWEWRRGQGPARQACDQAGGRICRSSGDLPDAIAWANHAGWRPRPDQVRPCPSVYFGATVPVPLPLSPLRFVPKSFAFGEASRAPRFALASPGSAAANP